jgi:hypothetical protein
MNKQPEALRLADALASPLEDANDFADIAAAELRRLHGLDFALRDCELALQKMATKYMDAVDQRDALLEALRPFTKATLTYNGAIIGLMREDFDNARAAIARAEGEKT